MGGANTCLVALSLISSHIELPCDVTSGTFSGVIVLPHTLFQVAQVKEAKVDIFQLQGLSFSTKHKFSKK